MYTQCIIKYANKNQRKRLLIRTVCADFVHAVFVSYMSVNKLTVCVVDIHQQVLHAVYRLGGADSVSVVPVIECIRTCGNCGQSSAHAPHCCHCVPVLCYYVRRIADAAVIGRENLTVRESYLRQAVTLCAVVCNANCILYYLAIKHTIIL